MYCITCNWLVSSAESLQRLILLLLFIGKANGRTLSRSKGIRYLGVYIIHSWTTMMFYNWFVMQNVPFIDPQMQFLV